MFDSIIFVVVELNVINKGLVMWPQFQMSQSIVDLRFSQNSTARIRSHIPSPQINYVAYVSIDVICIVNKGSLPEVGSGMEVSRVAIGLVQVPKIIMIKDFNLPTFKRNFNLDKRTTPLHFSMSST